MEVLIVLIIILIIAIKEQIGIHTYIHKHKKETEEEVQQIFYTRLGKTLFCLLFSLFYLKSDKCSSKNTAKQNNTLHPLYICVILYLSLTHPIQ